MYTNDLFDAVMQLDLEPIKKKLMHAASGEGWSLEKANAVEKEYRRFLCLMKMYPDEDTAPLVDVDTFWHYHILDTMKYAADCERVFGYFLHHYPYVGMGDEDDEQFRLDSGDRMRTLYEATFGEPYPGAAAATAQESKGADTAFCASPHVTATAFCASPHGKDLAFCASPHKPDSAPRTAAMNTDTAFCASPHGKDVAFCASPHTPERAPRSVAMKTGIAFCASPHTRESAPLTVDINTDTAFCASPHGKETAFCASPHVKAKAAAHA
jgi:hypothetical protein